MFGFGGMVWGRKEMKMGEKVQKYTAHELEIMAQIKRLRLCVLVHSIIYYRLNTSIISDFQYDKFAKKLKALQDKYGKLSAGVVEYRKEFEGWDGCSGYNLPLGDIWGYNKALYLVREFGTDN